MARGRGRPATGQDISKVAFKGIDGARLVARPGGKRNVLHFTTPEGGTVELSFTAKGEVGIMKLAGNEVQASVTEVQKV